MKKRIMSIILGAVMAFSLAACGGSGGATIESTDAKEEAEAPAENAEAPAEGAEAEEKPAKQTTKKSTKKESTEE